MSQAQAAIEALRARGKTREADLAEQALAAKQQESSGGQPAPVAQQAAPQSIDVQALNAGRVTIPMLEGMLKNALANNRQDNARRIKVMLDNAKEWQAERDREQAKNGFISEFEGLADADDGGGLPYEVESQSFDPRQLIDAPTKHKPGFTEGLGETMLSLGTAVTGGTVGMIAGTLEGMAKEVMAGEFGTRAGGDRIEQTAMKRAEQLTYSPRGEVAQEKTAAVGKALEPLAAVAPLAEFAIASQLVAPIARPLGQGARTGAERVRERLGFGARASDDLSPEAAAAAAARRAEAEQLGFTGEAALTRGQETRSPSQQRFERTAAATDEGAVIRERFDNQNAKAAQIIDDFIDETGSRTAQTGSIADSTRAIGQIVDDALTSRMNRDKTRMRTIREQARKAGELEAPVLIQGLDDYLNTNRAARTTDDIMNKVQREIEVKGLGTGNFKDGTLKLNPMTLNQAEDLRVFINRNTNWANPPEVPVSAQLKNIIDASTETLGGSLYQKYRKARVQFANDYENAALIKRLTDTKRGTNDRAVALENVIKESVFKPTTSLDMLKQFRRILQTQGKEGKQAWKEIQGGTLRQIKEAALRGSKINQRGDKVFNASQLDRVIKQLDDSGKLDFIFTPKGAEKLRTLNNIAQTLMTVTPGGGSGASTATILAGMMDVAISAGSGIPAPITSALRLIGAKSKDAKLKSQIRKALGE